MTYSELYNLYINGETPTILKPEDLSVDDTDPRTGKSMLHLACEFADSNTIRSLLDSGASVNAKDEYGFTPIYYLANAETQIKEENLISCAGIMIEGGASIPRSGSESNALIASVKKGRFALCRLFIENANRISSVDIDGENVYHALTRKAAQLEKNIRRAEKGLGGNAEELKASQQLAFDLMKKIAEEELIDTEEKNGSGETAYDIAVSYDAVNTANVIKGEEASVAGGMSIFKAIYNQNKDAFREIVESGADLNEICEDKQTYEFVGKSPLACTLLWSEFDKAELLLKSGADPNLHFPDERTAINIWITNDRPSGSNFQFNTMVKALTDAGLDINAKVDKDENSALMLACRHVGNGPGKAVAKHLLRMKADINATNVYGQNALMMLYGARAWNGDPEFNGGKGPFRWKESEGAELEILELLLDAGADTKMKDNWGNTLLHYMGTSCTEGIAREAAELLADFELPDIESVNNDGKTAMDIATEYNNEAFFKFILKNY